MTATSRAYSDYLDQFAARLVQDAIASAMPATWLRRAAQFEAARPRPGDYVGRATPEQITERDRRLRALAEACRGRATVSDLSALTEHDRALVEQLLTDAAA